MGLVALITGSIVLIVRHVRTPVPDTYLQRADAHVVSCKFDGEDLTATVDLVNRLGQKANLIADVEFDVPKRYPAAIGTVLVEADKVPAGHSVRAGATGTTDPQLAGVFDLDVPKVTCQVVLPTASNGP